MSITSYSTARFDFTKPVSFGKTDPNSNAVNADLQKIRAMMPTAEALDRGRIGNASNQDIKDLTSSPYGSTYNLFGTPVTAFGPTPISSQTYKQLSRNPSSLNYLA